MSEKRRALGRGLGALIPNGPSGGSGRPVDVFFAEQGTGAGPSHDTPGESEPGVGEPGDHGPGDHGSGVDASSPPAGSVAADPDPSGAPELLPVPGVTFADIPLDDIRPNPRQPRTVFDEDELAELVSSIAEIGVLQPVVVRPVAEGGDALDGVHYELIMGERRWRASRLAGKQTVPAIVKATDDDVLLRDALLENLHRSQLNPLEEAAAYQQLLDDFGCTQEELAGRIHRSRPQVSNTLRLLRLPPPVARRVAAGVLSAGHARAILALPDAAAMERLAQRVVAEGLSVRSVEEIVAVGGDEHGTPTRRRPRAGARRPQLDDLAAELSDRLDTKVAITLGQRKGKVTVEFASVDDLNRILDILGVRTTSSSPVPLSHN